MIAMDLLSSNDSEEFVCNMLCSYFKCSWIILNICLAGSTLSYPFI